MRRLITFIVRLWVDAQATPPVWEGQIECIANSEYQHIRTPEELLAFVAAHTGTRTEEEPMHNTLKHIG